MNRAEFLFLSDANNVQHDYLLTVTAAATAFEHCSPPAHHRQAHGCTRMYTRGSRASKERADHCMQGN